MTSLFSNDYLPDRLDIQDVDSIAYMEFVETQKRKNDFSIIIKFLNLSLEVNHARITKSKKSYFRICYRSA